MGGAITLSLWENYRKTLCCNIVLLLQHSSMVVTTPSLNFLFPSIKYFFHLCTVQCMHITSHGHGTPNQLFFYGQQHPVCQESCFLKFKSMSAKLNISYAPLRQFKTIIMFCLEYCKSTQTHLPASHFVPLHTLLHTKAKMCLKNLIR